MKLKKWLTLSLAGALLVGGMVTASAAELDTAWYAAKNPDVVAELGDSPEALRNHYEMFGRKEGREANDHDVEAKLRKLFKAEEYAALYPDVAEALGEDAEALFAHYIGYGLLEARRPAEKVPQAVAATLKTAVEKALADAGIAAAPGSAQLVEIITGTIPADEGGAAVQAALAQAAPAVEKAVAAAVEETTNPTPSSGGGSSSAAIAEKTVTLRVYEVKWSEDSITFGKKVSSNSSGSADYNIMISPDNYKKDGGTDAYWFAAFLEVDEGLLAERGYDEANIQQWIKINNTWTNVTTDKRPSSGTRPAGYGFLIGVAEDENEMVKIALGSEEEPQDGINALVVEFNVTLTRPTITVYNDVDAGEGDNVGVVASYTGKSEITATGGNGTSDSPYTFNETINVLGSSQVGSTYWVIVNPGLGNITSISVDGASDVQKNKYFVDNLQNKEQVFGLGDDGIGASGGVKVGVTTSAGTVYYQLKLSAMQSTASSAAASTTALTNDEGDGIEIVSTTGNVGPQDPESDGLVSDGENEDPEENADNNADNNADDNGGDALQTAGEGNGTPDPAE